MRRAPALAERDEDDVMLVHGCPGPWEALTSQGSDALAPRDTTPRCEPHPPRRLMARPLAVCRRASEAGIEGCMGGGGGCAWREMHGMRAFADDWSQDHACHGFATTRGRKFSYVMNLRPRTARVIPDSRRKCAVPAGAERHVRARAERAWRVRPALASCIRGARF